MATAAAHPEPTLLAAFSLGKLQDPTASSIEAHLTDCESCCAQLEQIASDDSFVDMVRGCVTDERSPSAVTVAMNVTSIEPLHSGLIKPERQHVELLAASLRPKYEVLQLIGLGGMGAVYRAEHRLMRREVALKIIRPEMLKKPAAIDRFQQEARAAAKLAHPNIVTAYDAEQIGLQHLLVMEFVEGKNLAEHVAAEGPLQVADACRYIVQAAQGLQHAYEQGMVHRDIKPQNLMITSQRTIKILDFGLASLVATELEEELSASSEVNEAESARLTHASTTIGTPDYIAPEQVEDPREADTRADIYGLGCTLYFLLTGSAPFAQLSLAEKLLIDSRPQPTPIDQFRDDVPPPLVQVINRMMERDAARRYQTPAEVAEALQPFVTTAGIAHHSAELPPSTPYRPLAVSGNDDALKLVESPANGILGVAVLNLVLGVWSLSAMPDPGDHLYLMLAAVSAIISIPATLLMIQGAQRMRRLENYRWAYAAAICAVIPWTPVWVLGLPMGLWAFVRLSNPIVRRGFGLEPFSPRQRFRRLALTGCMTLVPISLAAAGIVYVETNEGTIAIDAHDPHVQVKVLQNGEVVEILDPTSQQAARLDVGIYSIQLHPEGFAMSIPENEPFTLHRGQQKLVTVRRSKSAEENARASAQRPRASATQVSLDLVRTFHGHIEPIYSLSVVDDLLASASSYGTARLWNSETGELINKFPGHRLHRPLAVALSPGGKHIATGDWDGKVRAFDHQGTLFTEALAHADGVYQIVYSPDGSQLLTTGCDHTARLWNAKSLEQLQVFRGHDHWVCDGSFAPDGRRIATASLDQTLRVWDAATGTQLFRCGSERAEHWSLAWSSDGLRIAAGLSDHSVRVYDAESGKELHVLRAHQERVQDVAFSPDGKRLYSGAYDNTLRAWDANTGNELWRAHHEHHIFNELAVLPDGLHIATAGGVWKPDSNRDEWDLEGDYEIRLWRLPGRTNLSAGADTAMD